MTDNYYSEVVLGAVLSYLEEMNYCNIKFYASDTGDFLIVYESFLINEILSETNDSMARLAISCHLAWVSPQIFKEGRYRIFKLVYEK